MGLCFAALRHQILLLDGGANIVGHQIKETLEQLALCKMRAEFLEEIGRDLLQQDVVVAFKRGVDFAT